VTIDDHSGVRQAVEHLAALGHRSLAYASGPASSWSNRQRRAAFEQATNEAGLDSVVLGPYAPRFDGGVQAADVVLARGATAVLAYNDVMACGVISRLQARAVEVPRDVSVVGFDDIPTAAIWSPPLTSISASTRAVAKAAVQAVLRLPLENGVNGKSRTLPSHLVVRGSAGVSASAS
jgi:DNA-binding LacI/PurR family transcriptional regulator